MPRGNHVPLGSEVTLPEARTAAEKLKAAGIPCYIRGEAAALIAADPARVAVQIEVDEEDLEHAQLILSAPAGAAPKRHTAVDGLATVEVFYDALEAKHAADLLRTRGIPCGLRGTTGPVLSWLSPEVPLLRLEVGEADLERAFEVLGFTVDEDEGNESAMREDDTPETEHIRAAEPPPSRQIERHPFVPVDVPRVSAERIPPPVAQALAAPAERSSVEADGGSGAAVLLLVLLLVAGTVLGLGLYLLL